MSSMVRFVECEGWQVAVEGIGDEEAKIRDIDLAEKLGYTRPRKIRELIDRLVKEGKLGQVCMRPTVGRYESKPGVWQEREVQEYWLTESQALKVIAKSATEIADKILDQVIRVFLYVRKHGLTQQVAAGYTDPVAQKLHAEASLLTAKRKYYEDTEVMVTHLEARQLITADTALAHRIKLIKDTTGYDLTVPPSTTLTFGNVGVAVSGAVPTKGVTLEVPGGLPVTAIHTVVTADLTGFIAATALGRKCGVSRCVVGEMARAVGIFRKLTDVPNEWGVLTPRTENGQAQGYNWRYSSKAEEVLTPLLIKVRDRRAVSRITMRDAVYAVSKEWLAVSSPPKQVVLN